jgi:hypothetical protein
VIPGIKVLKVSKVSRAIKASRAIRVILVKMVPELLFPVLLLRMRIFPAISLPVTLDIRTLSPQMDFCTSGMARNFPLMETVFSFVGLKALRGIPAIKVLKATPAALARLVQTVRVVPSGSQVPEVLLVLEVP